ALRIIIDEAWALGEADESQLLEFGAKLARFAAKHEASVMSVYSRRKLNPETILSAIKTHPIVVAGGFVCKNFYYVPPDEFARTAGRGSEVARLLENLLERQQVQTNLEDARSSLESKVEKRTKELADANKKLLAEMEERKRREKEVRTANELLERIFSTTNMLLAYLDREFRYIKVNRAFADYSCKKPGDLTGARHFDIFPDAEMEAKFKEVINFGTPIVGLGERLEFPSKEFDSPRYWDFDVIPVKDSRNKVEGALFCLVDVTERVIAELGLRELTEHLDELVKTRTEELARSEERYRTLAENSPLGVYRTTPDGKILYCNPAILRMLGYSSFEEAANRNLEEEGLEPQYSRADFKHALETQGSIVGLESAWKTKDGNTIFVRENAKAIRDKQGKVIYYDGTVEDITRRKAAEDALLKSERLLKTSLNAMEEWVHVIDSGRTVIYASESLRRMLASAGMNDKIDGLALRDALPFVTDDTMDEYSLVFETGTPQMTSDRIALGDSVFVAEIKKVPVSNGGKVDTVVTVFRDITKHVLAEETRRESEERYKKLVDTSIDAIVVHCEGKIVFANPAAAQLFGAKSPDDLLGMAALDLAHPDGREAILQKRRILESGGFVGPTEGRFVRLDGAPIDVEVTAASTTFGGRLAIQMMIRDISGRKLAARKSETQFRTIINALKDSVFLVDNSGVVLEVNDAACKLRNISRADLIRRSVFFGLEERLAESRRKRLEDCVRSGQPVFFEDTRDDIFFENHLYPILDDDGKTTSVVIYAHDATERKRADWEKDSLIRELTAAITEIKTLKGLIPICASCKRIRDDAGFWQQIESYVEQHSGAEFSHSLCPACAKTLYPELYAESEGEGGGNEGF
ncbi:MAG: PAS domain S-box protein, partial [bacterium]